MQSMNRFSFNPANLDIPRSLFDRSSNRYQSLTSGKLNVIYVDEMLPGDSVTMKTNAFIRMAKPILPAMDPLFCDVFFFFVPMRLVWNNYKQFFGENDSTAWTRATNKTLPCLDGGSTNDMEAQGAYLSGCLLDQLGVHLGADNTATTTPQSGTTPLDALVDLNTLPIRAYGLIANEWFRDENYEAPYIFSKGDSGQYDHYWTNYPGAGSAKYIHRDGLFPVSALHDYFTSALPAPQKSADIRPIGEKAFSGGSYSGLVPVSAKPTEHITSGDALSSMIFRGINVNAGGLLANRVIGTDGDGLSRAFSTVDGMTPATYAGVTNLYASLPAEIFASVNQIRYAFALQRFFEKDARGGTRYREKIKAHFGVTGSDSSMMVPEYVGGQRFMLNMDTILTTADTSTGTTGEYAGYSKTFQSLPQWSFSTSEHGYLLGVCCIRPKMTYHQGIPRLFSRKDQLDFYWPSFANLGEQPILKKEIYADAPAAGDNEGVFGYNEPYGEYRYKPDELVGALRPESEDFIPGFTYARKFGSQAQATAAAARSCNPAIVSQNLAVPTGYQFVSMFRFEAKWRRPMPVYSIPGLVDHH